MAFLAGRGLGAKAVAADPLIGSTPFAVYEAARRYGIAFSDVPQGDLMISVGGRMTSLIAEAKRRRETAEVLASRLVRILVDEPAMLANVLDDEA